MIFTSGPVCTPCAPRSAQRQAPGVTGMRGAAGGTHHAGAERRRTTSNTRRGMHTLCRVHTSWGVGVELRRTHSNIHSQMWGGEGSGGTTPQKHRETSSLRRYRQGNDGRKGKTGEVDEAQFLPETLQNAPQWNDCF